ncbi:MAG: SPFH domain-containing protein [Bacteroidaceae bacterium]|nr:SPFH domain-containing protein [Bacteroidaceae bacterium]
MEKKEFAYSGFIMNGILMLVLVILMFIGSLAAIVYSGISIDDAVTLGNSPAEWVCAIVLSILALILSIIFMCGFFQVEPGEAQVLMFFGRYRGTFTDAGFYWANPFITAKKLSLRARNLDADPIKVNDKAGNPVMIGLVLVWKLKDTYKAMFEVDTQTMAAARVGANQVGAPGAAVIMNALQNFVSIQADAALRQVAGQYAYDNEEDEDAITLRDGSDEINKELEAKISERLDMAGIDVIEARINYLAYAPEIAAVMLRRQQATAIIAAREKIVEGAVSMVKMALDKLNDEKVVELNDERKAAMVSNLLVVLCGDDNAQPVVNAGN